VGGNGLSGGLNVYWLPPGAASTPAMGSYGPALAVLLVLLGWRWMSRTPPSAFTRPG
jgi:hypothetical protein